MAFELSDQGKRPSDLGMKALGLKPKTRHNYFQEWEEAHPKKYGSAPGFNCGTTIMYDMGDRGCLRCDQRL